jgi:hypothetical protein
MPAASPARARLILSYNAGAGMYQLPDRTLRPGEQMWVDVAELVRDEVPDAEGHTLPTSALDGYGLRRHRRTRPAPYASHLVLVHRLAPLLRASFRPSVTGTPLRFAMTCKSGGCALKAVELTSGDLLFVPESGLRVE